MLEALDVTIGLVLVYLLLSLFATNVAEAVSQVAGLRARHLRRAIERLLGGSGALARDFYADPRIRSLSTGRRDPSYLPRETVAEVLLDLVVGPGGADLPADKRGDVIASFGWAGPAEPTPDAPEKDEEVLARRRLATILARISDDAGNDGALVRVGAAQWFDAAMERAAGSYRRTMQFILLATGLAIAFATDADTIRISRVLMEDSALRAAVADAADAGAPQLADIGQVLGWTVSEWARVVFDPSSLPGKLLGMFLTALAVSLGAPFWFNALQGLLQLRSSLRPNDRKNPPDDGTGRGVATATRADEALVTAGVAAASSEAIDAEAVFEPEAVVYTPGNAWMFAVVSRAAYLGLPGFRAALPGTWDTTRIADPTTDTLLYVARSDRAVIVAFRGTESMADVLTDVRYDFNGSESHPPRNTPTDPIMIAMDSQASANTDVGSPLVTKGSTHAGFWLSLEAVWPQLERVLIAATAGSEGESRAVHFCGHSLGGALAVMASARWKRGRPDRRAPCVYTYGQPRCGDHGYAEELDRQMGHRIFRHVNHRDAVPRLPPRSFGYRHAGRCLYFDARARLHDSPAAWFQVLDTIPIAPDSLLSNMRETVGDHGSQEYVRLTRQQLG